MLGLVLAQGLYGPEGEAWPQYRHNYKRTGFYVWPAECVSISHMYDVVHGSIDESIIGMDANGDGAVDIIGAQQSSSAYGVKAFDGPTGSALWETGGDYFPGPGIASVAASDSLVFANGYYYFRALNITDGAILYQHDKPDGRGPSPAIADADGDGCPEVYTSYGTEAVVLDGCASTYTPLWNYTLPAVAHAPALGDINGDGELEVLYPLTNGEIYVFDALTGSLHSSFAAGVSSSVDIFPDYTVALGDVDGDGKDEVVVPTATSVSVYKYAGFIFGWRSLWTVSGYTQGSPVALANRDGDGLPDVWVVHDGELYVYKGTDGSLLANSSGFNVDGVEGRGYPPTLVDLTGDRFPDVLAPSGNYYVRVLDGLSLTLVGTYGTTPYSISSEVVVLRLGGSLAFAVGDYSCHINVWGVCPLAWDDPTGISERPQRSADLSFVEGGIVVFASKPITLSIYDVTGRVVKRVEVEGERRIETSDLPKGVYVVRFAGRTYRLLKR
ncbi:MAG: T9SS type A sorting domain-containing protein [Thermotogae bacterium]|nr:T9SS type A sorting domain-containing protein [Thermotogota bacterium]